MKKSPIAWTMAFAALAPLLGCLILASAQESSDKKATGSVAKKDEADKAGPPVASRFHDAEPDKRSSSEVQFKPKNGREQRVVLIHPQSKTSANYVPGLRFHRPLGALVEREKAIEGFPPVVDDIRRNGDGSVWLRFRVVVSSPELRRQCRDAVLEKERTILAKEKLTQDDIVVEPWPLKHCVITMKDTFKNEILGVGQTDTLTAIKDEFFFTMLFSQAELAKVLDLIRQGDIGFIFSYSYVGSSNYTGTVDLKSSKNAKLIASQCLRSEQVQGKKVEGTKEPVLEPIFQAEANDAVRHVNATVEKTMRVGHKDLLPLLDTPTLFQKLFADDGLLYFKDLGDKEAALIMAIYLKPQVEQVRESFGEEKTHIKVNEDGSVTLSDEGVTTKQLLARIQNATGTKYEKVEGKETFRPHSIKKFKFQNNADTVQIDEKTTAFLSVGPENGYLEDSPISVTFTSKMAKDTDLHSGDLGPYSGVPIGAMVPYFGAKLPKGYVWADGQSNFPWADWVPAHLRGEKVPDTRKYIVGGAATPLDVGKVWNGGKLQFTVEGSKFLLPEGESQPRSTVDMVQWRRGPQVPGVFVTRDQPAQVTILNIDTSHFKYSGCVKGNQEFTIQLRESNSNPRHVMCNWIIRLE